MNEAPPRSVVKLVLEAVEAGQEDVYPDPIALELHAGLISDSDAVEKQVAEMLPE